MTYDTEHIHGYMSADEADIVFITVNQRDQILYASARVRKTATRLRVELSQFENPDGEYVQDHPLSQKCRNGYGTTGVSCRPHHDVRRVVSLIR